MKHAAATTAAHAPGKSAQQQQNADHSVSTAPDSEAAGQPAHSSPQAEQASTSSAAGQSNRPDCYVIVYNVSKHSNVGTLLRSCTAFGVKAACLVGSRQFNTFGSHGASEHVQLIHFPTLEACCTHLKDTAGCRVLGVEIDAAAVPVNSHPFSGNTAFMLGNEGQGLSEKQMRLCDGFVYIPQHGPGTASLNVTVAASIVLHQFAVWAGYEERQREGAKFVVDPRPQRTTPRGFVPPTPEEQAAVRQQRQGFTDSETNPEEGSEAWLANALQQHGGVDGLLEAVQHL